jgi:hypothetical protein
VRRSNPVALGLLFTWTRGTLQICSRLSHPTQYDQIKKESAPNGSTICKWLSHSSGWQHFPLRTYHGIFFKGGETLCGYKQLFIFDEKERVNIEIFCSL